MIKGTNTLLPTSQWNTTARLPAYYTLFPKCVAHTSSNFSITSTSV